MAHPIGLPSEKLPDGTWVGMTPLGMQQVIGNQYLNAGVIPGGTSGTPVRGTTGWSYQAPRLAVHAWVSEASRLGVLVPILGGTLPVSAPVGGAARSDVIHVGSDGVVRVTEGATSAPGGSVVLGVMNIPAGATSTQSAVDSHDRVYAIPAGASMGRRDHWDIPGGTWGGALGQDVVRHTSRFTVPTDRTVRVDMSLSAEAAAAGEGWSAFGVEIDGTWRRALHCVFDQGRQRTYSATWTTSLTAGAHTLTVFTVQFEGPAMKTSGSASASEVNLWDAGVSQ